jgi:hypothetical protein
MNSYKENKNPEDPGSVGAPVLMTAILLGMEILF